MAPIYPINPHARTIAGRPSIRDALAEVPTPVELAIIAVAAPRRPGRRARLRDPPGVPALVVLSARLRRGGRRRAAPRQAELLGICRGGGDAARRTELPGRLKHGARGSG